MQYFVRILYYWFEDDQLSSELAGVINCIIYTSCDLHYSQRWFVCHSVITNIAVTKSVG